MRLLVATVATASPLSSASAECNSHTCRWKPYSNSTDFQANASVLLILFVSALICALSLYAAIRCFLRPTLETDDNDHKPDPEADASSTVPTPTLVYSPDLELAGAEAECAICLSEFEQGESIQVLEKCHHGFHVKCIHKWLSSRSSCPTCRTCIFSQETSDSVPSTEAPSTSKFIKHRQFQKSGPKGFIQVKVLQNDNLYMRLDLPGVPDNPVHHRVDAVRQKVVFFSAETFNDGYEEGVREYSGTAGLGCDCFEITGVDAKMKDGVLRMIVSKGQGEEP